MLVGDLIYSNDFDCNCNIEIYDCTEDGLQYGDGAEMIFSGWSKPLNSILDMKIKYITTNKDMAIVIEATR